MYVLGLLLISLFNFWFDYVNEGLVGFCCLDLLVIYQTF